MSTPFFTFFPVQKKYFKKTIFGKPGGGKTTGLALESIRTALVK
ncbi:hypothetical protein ACSYAY_05885 [Leptospirillum ferriphilum]|uniref:Uncharacterized protein n=1 Tax=Leptospirillum ferriphilum TaxID=178606 RepID=A0A094WFI6_9BACT|nr:hypothetical protein [Leptospirillum ferriphilum]KGA94407.1 hypothetical protein LptCag_1170 [Leptospirillum ferriphilum]